NTRSRVRRRTCISDFRRDQGKRDSPTLRLDVHYSDLDLHTRRPGTNRLQLAARDKPIDMVVDTHEDADVVVDAVPALVVGAGSPGGPCCSGLVLVLGDAAADVVHVHGAGLLDQLLQLRFAQRAGLGVQDDPVADDHQGRDRGDLEGAGRLLLGLGVYLADHDGGVLRGDPLVDGCEEAAGLAPAGREVDHDHVVAVEDVLDVLARQFSGGHHGLLQVRRYPYGYM